jgi:phosphatidylglycerophosphate synthase
VRTVRTGFLAGVGAQTALLLVLAATVGLHTAGWLAGLAYGVALNGVLARAHARSGRVGPRPADRVTLTRATLVGGIVALVADSFATRVPLGTLTGLAVVALVLDGVDGRVARRTGTATAIGARFDMEVDAFLILVLSVVVAGSVGPWVLVLGAARYAFWIGGRVLPWLRRPVPPRYWRKMVAAVQGVTLTAVASGIVPVRVAEAVLAVAAALLAESFGRDVWWLARSRSAVAAGAGARILGPVGG